MRVCKVLAIVVFTILLFGIVFVISGCGATVDKLRDKDFTVGCECVVEKATIGYAVSGNVAGVEIGKVKCSDPEKLPDDYYIECKDPRSGFKATIGIKPND